MTHTGLRRERTLRCPGASVYGHRVRTRDVTGKRPRGPTTALTTALLKSFRGSLSVKVSWLANVPLFSVLLVILVHAMPASGGNFFPPEYKQFPFKEGDLLVSGSSSGRFSITKILKVDRFDFKKGFAINIQGKSFVATEDDYLLVVSVAYGADLFGSFEEARVAAQSGAWKAIVQHMPLRTPGVAKDHALVGNAEEEPPRSRARCVPFRWRAR